ncbi:preprotein translocase subunit SecG [Flavobacterium piscinae]|uniref:preprotein translocase subunit SecG n=1 Tax=Flavobacterium piscinae TaxID=2506424 RepID=UPI0019C09447|nr:preprotein translocase subunit SecG [Flavobacterium piscinae]MBC8883378.1 preprotein translocase subunit SecG [Flavobacterium piscinae]
MGFSVFLVLITIVCFLLIVVIMVQNPKGGGLSSTFGNSQQIGGVQKTTDFLDKSTWTLGIILIALIMFSSLAFNDNNESIKIDKSNVPAKTEISAPAETTAPTASPTPAETTPAKRIIYIIIH